MNRFEIDALDIRLDQHGTNAYTKASYPLRYGRFAEIRTGDFVFQFNLNGELKFINGRGKSWPDHSEWLKRTIADDWVYYSSNGYNGLYDCFGEYYIPSLRYPTNNITSFDPFNNSGVINAIHAWDRLHKQLTEFNSCSFPEKIREFLNQVILNSPART